MESTVRAYTICNTEFPQLPQAGIQGLARRRDNSLDSNTPHGAAQAFIDKTQLKWEVQKTQAPDLKPILLSKCPCAVNVTYK